MKSRRVVQVFFNAPTISTADIQGLEKDLRSFGSIVSRLDATDDACKYEGLFLSYRYIMTIPNKNISKMYEYAKSTKKHNVHHIRVLI